jgi:hypothetical protein
LLAVLDGRSERLGADADASLEARLARAEAQVTGILVHRLLAALRTSDHEALTEQTMRSVAAHELDPHSAASVLLSTLSTETTREPRT